MQRDLLSTFQRIFGSEKIGHCADFEVDPSDESEQQLRCSRFKVFYSEDKQTIDVSTPGGGDSIEMNVDVLQFIGNYYELATTHECLDCFTENVITTVDGKQTRVRCHSNYHGGGPWNDWGLIKFQGDTVPAKFHCWINEPGQKPVS